METLTQPAIEIFSPGYWPLECSFHAWSGPWIPRGRVAESLTARIDAWAQVLTLTLSCVTLAKFWDLSGPRSPRSEHKCDLAATLQPGMSYYLHSVQKEACAGKGFHNVYIQTSIATKCQLCKRRWLDSQQSFRRVTCFEETK